MLIEDARTFVYCDSHIRECNPWPQRKAIERRPVNRYRPITFRRRKALGARAIQFFHANFRVSGSGAIVFQDGFDECAAFDAEKGSKGFERIRLKRLKHGRQKTIDCFGIHNTKCLLPRLRSDQAAPDGVPLGPDLFPLIVEAPSDADLPRCRKESRPEPRHDPAVKFGRAGIHGNRMKTFRIADRFRSMLEQRGQEHSVVIRRAANYEIVGRVSPVALQPFDVGLVSTGSHNDGSPADQFLGLSGFYANGVEAAIINDQFFDSRVVAHSNSHSRRGFGNTY